MKALWSCCYPKSRSRPLPALGNRTEIKSGLWKRINCQKYSLLVNRGFWWDFHWKAGRLWAQTQALDFDVCCWLPQHRAICNSFATLLFSKLLLHHKHLFLTTKLHLFNRKQLRVFKRLTSGVLGCSPASLWASVLTQGTQQHPGWPWLIECWTRCFPHTHTFHSLASIDHGLILKISDWNWIWLLSQPFISYVMQGYILFCMSRTKPAAAFEKKMCFQLWSWPEYWTTVLLLL